MACINGEVPAFEKYVRCTVNDLAVMTTWRHVRESRARRSVLRAILYIGRYLFLSSNARTTVCYCYISIHVAAVVITIYR